MSSSKNLDIGLTDVGFNSQATGINGKGTVTNTHPNLVLIGDDTKNVLIGGAGDDILAPGKTTAPTGQADTVDGGSGNDTVSFEWQTKGVYVNLLAGVATDAIPVTHGPAVSANLFSIENAIGGLGNDILIGNAVANTLSGGAGNDQLYGFAGNDVLNGQDGDDILRGDEGADYLNGGQGTDRADYYNSNAGVTINLSAGTGLGGHAQGDVLVSIENIYASHFDDVLMGTAGDNVFYGESGNDQLYGLAGNDQLNGQDGDDILRGDEGADVLFGGNGTDRADYYNSNAGVTINLSAGTGLGGHAQGDLLYSIENIYASHFDDVLIGTAGDNVFYGETGNDQLYGLAGNDQLNGQDGDDILRGDEGADVLFGGAGIDRADYYNSDAGVTINLTLCTGLGGHAHGDTLYSIENVYGSQFNDVLVGNAVDNVLFGDLGDDKLYGEEGNDVLYGQAGADTLFGGHGNDILSGGEGNDGMFGDAGNDTLYGGHGNDYLAGGDGNDILWGEAGNDQIDAGAGNDFVVLGVGDDAFTLGAGDDRVLFEYGNGKDTIFDFGNGHDVIDFSATDMNLAVLKANAVDTAAGTLLQLGSGSILLAGVALHQIEWTYDFAFAH